MKPTSVRLAHVATAPAGFPRDGKPEVAIMGRSNVGKSSLLNKLFHRVSMARVSKTPGRTREVHFYEVDEKLYLVDLPGYGYAKVPESMRRKWGKLIDAYLTEREPLRLAVQLIDARHDPTKLDVMLTEALLAREVPFVIALTKSDKLSGSQRPRALSRTRKALDLPRDIPVIPTSARTGRGVAELSKEIFRAAFSREEVS